MRLLKLIIKMLCSLVRDRAMIVQGAIRSPCEALNMSVLFDKNSGDIEGPLAVGLTTTIFHVCPFNSVISGIWQPKL